MPKILVLFASKSDEEIYKGISHILKKEKQDFQLRISSAHKSPEDVDEIISGEKYDAVISGAGLAAALPGAIASKTLKPVIGIPVKGNYHGLDALLSIAQMPPGIPVIAVGVNNVEAASYGAIKMLNPFSTVNIIADDNEDKAVKKAVEILKSFGVKYNMSDKADSSAINLEFAFFDEPIEKRNELVINCPLLTEKQDTPESALNFYKHTGHGLWVGINNGTNAALAAIEILNLNGKYTDKIIQFRKEQRDKLKKADEEMKR